MISLNYKIDYTLDLRAWATFQVLLVSQVVEKSIVWNEDEFDFVIGSCWQLAVFWKWDKYFMNFDRHFHLNLQVSKNSS